MALDYGFQLVYKLNRNSTLNYVTYTFVFPIIILGLIFLLSQLPKQQQNPNIHKSRLASSSNHPPTSITKSNFYFSFSTNS
ncbi:hypothetical protein HanIR_Chr09g0429831 [Helianthus annuus]|nr:hypothetical protein HanIR_Chr09g0429831 [Helianthus annuus]